MDIKSEYERQLKMLNACMTYKPRKKHKVGTSR